MNVKLRCSHRIMLGIKTFDENVLSYIGGIRNNDLNKILETNEFDSNDELQTTRRSSYYDLDNFDKLTRKTNKWFSILSPRSAFDGLIYFPQVGF